MGRVARSIDYNRIRQLRRRIQDPDYVQGAVDRLAGRITERLLGIDDREELVVAHGGVQRSASSSNKDIARLLVDDE